MPLGRGRPLTYRTVWGCPHNVILGRLQDVVFQGPNDVGRGRPQNVGRGRPLRSHRGPMGTPIGRLFGKS